MLRSGGVSPVIGRWRDDDGANPIQIMKYDQGMRKDQVRTNLSQEASYEAGTFMVGKIAEEPQQANPKTYYILQEGCKDRLYGEEQIDSVSRGGPSFWLANRI